MTTIFSNKLVAVMNGKIKPGIIMNALARMRIGFGSEIPFLILKANSNKIRRLLHHRDAVSEL